MLPIAVSETFGATSVAACTMLEFQSTAGAGPELVVASVVPVSDPLPDPLMRL
jgi:hypothetical protein